MSLTPGDYAELVKAAMERGDAQRVVELTERMMGAEPTRTPAAPDDAVPVAMTPDEALLAEIQAKNNNAWVSVPLLGDEA